MADNVKARSGIGNQAPAEEKPANVDVKPSKLLFAILVVGVLVAIFAGSKSKHSAPADSSINPIWVILPWLLCGVLVVFIYWTCRRIGLVGMNEHQINNDAVKLMHSGELDAAAESLDGLLSRNPKKSLVRALFLCNRGYTDILQGNLESARQRLLEAKGDFKNSQMFGPDFPAILSGNIVVCEALLGNVDDADKELLAAVENLREMSEGLFVRPRGLVKLRRGDFVAADQIFSEGWRKAGGTNHEVEMKTLRILRAFALSHLESTSDRRSAMADLIAGCYPYEVGEFDYLAVKWPELKAFMIEQKLSAAE